MMEDNNSLKNERIKLQAALRITMIRLSPRVSHLEIDREIDRIVSPYAILKKLE